MTNQTIGSITQRVKRKDPRAAQVADVYALLVRLGYARTASALAQAVKSLNAERATGFAEQFPEQSENPDEEGRTRTERLFLSLKLANRIGCRDAHDLIACRIGA